MVPPGQDAKGWSWEVAAGCCLLSGADGSSTSLMTHSCTPFLPQMLGKGRHPKERYPSLGHLRLGKGQITVSCHVPDLESSLGKPTVVDWRILGI